MDVVVLSDKYRCWYPANTWPLQIFAHLCWLIVATFLHEIFREIGKNGEGIGWGIALFSQHHLITALKNLYILGFKTKFFRQPDGLAVTRLKYTRCCHDLTSIKYTKSIYIKEGLSITKSR